MYIMAASNSARCDGWNNVRDNHHQASMQFHLAEQPNEIKAVVRDKREFILDDSLGKFPVRLATQTEMVDVGCFETGAMSDSDQRLMQAFVDEEPHALLSRVRSG